MRFVADKGYESQAVTEEDVKAFQDFLKGVKKSVAIKIAHQAVVRT